MKSLMTLAGFCLLMLPLTGQQLYLPSSSNWLNLGDVSISGDQITLEALIYMEDVPITLNKFDILSKHEDFTNVNYFFRHTNFGLTTYDNGNSGPTTFNNLFSEYDYDLFRLYHVAATYDGSLMRYYVNGCLVNTLAASGNLYQNAFPTGLGQRWIIQDEQFIGYLDEVRIWNVTRTEEEIVAHMNELDAPQNQTGLIAYYTFEGDFTNIANPGLYDGFAEGNPLLATNGSFLLPRVQPPTIVTTPATCGENNGTLFLAPDEQLEYSLNGGQFTANPSWGNLPAGSYTVSVRAPNWCLPEASNTAIVLSEDFVNIFSNVQLCAGDSVFLLDQWISLPGSYETLLPGATGDCDTLLFYQVTAAPSPDFFQPEYTVCPEAPLELIGPTTATSWSNGVIGERVSLRERGVYSASWTDQNGCSREESFTLILDDTDPEAYYIPNVFSPNNDGVNDQFQIAFPHGQQPSFFELRIFNRWGGLVFSTNSPDAGWPGEFNGKMVQDGTYVYTVRTTVPRCGIPVLTQRAGSVQLMR